MKRKLQLNIPVIVYTNQNIIENSIRAKQSGVDHFFVLPALPYDIVTSINDVMRHLNTDNHNYDNTDILPQTHPHNKGISVLFKEYLASSF